MNISTISLTCTGNIMPSTVVKIGTTADFSCTAAVAASVPFGISQEWAKGAAGTPHAVEFAGVAGDTIEVYTSGKVCKSALKANSGALTAGASVGANADSEIVVVASGWAVGWLMESGADATDQLLRVFVFPHYLPA
jgi:hypothetical protein